MPGGFTLNGKKRFNARLDEATHVVIYTRAAEVPGKLSAFVAPLRGAARPRGLRVLTFAAHGLTGNSCGGLDLDDAFVPDSHLIGEDGKGTELFDRHFFYWRLMRSAAAIGTGENALKQTADRIKERKAFGGPIGRFTHLQIRGTHGPQVIRHRPVA